MANNKKHTKNILIDIGHPAHIHYFKNLAFYLLENGYDILFTVRDKEVVLNLIESYRFDYIVLGKSYKRIFGKILGIISFIIKLFFITLNFKPDLFINSTISSAFVAWIFRKPHISLEDTFNFEQVYLYLPFTSVILTGCYKHPHLGKKEIRYDGYQELAYLHPNRFKPNQEILSLLGVKADEKYVILRFVSWGASHDFGHSGISFKNKIKAVEEFSKLARIFISSEKKLPAELDKYRIKIPPQYMHDALYYSSLLWGESATMASECAVLGVPSIYIDNTGRYYTREQEEKYGLVFNFSESVEDQILSIKKGIEILKKSNSKSVFNKRKNKLLSDKIDVSSFLIWFVQNYPKSFRIMKENPNYYMQFY